MTQELRKSMEAIAHTRKEVVVKRGKADYSDKVYYVNAKITGASNTISLIDANTKKIAGLTNFDGNVIGLGKAFPVSGIRLLYNKGNDTTKEGEVGYSSAMTLPGALLNAIVTLKQGSKVLLQLPVSDLYGFKMKEFRMVATLPVLRDKDPFELEIEMPNGIALPVTAGTQEFIRIEFKGVERKSL